MAVTKGSSRSKDKVGTPAIPTSREDMVAFLESQGIRNANRYSKPELECLVQEHLAPPEKAVRKDPCMGLSALTKPDLRELAKLWQVPQYMDLTNPKLMIQIRHKVEEVNDQLVGFGRLKTLSMEVAATEHGEYCEWASKQLEGSPHPRLQQLVALYRMYNRYYPRPREVKEEVKTESPRKYHWPTEPEEEYGAAAPAARTKVPPKSKPEHFKLYKQEEEEVPVPETEDEQEDDHVDDTPPAWREKKQREAKPQGVKRK
jgi:hypothetical protein